MSEPKIEDCTPRGPFYPAGAPFQLVQLFTLPVEQWIGRAVLHPGEQRGSEAYWYPEDSPDAALDEGSDREFVVGVVTAWTAENWRAEPENPSAHEVTFLLSNGGQLRTGAWALWTPKPDESA